MQLLSSFRLARLLAFQALILVACDAPPPGVAVDDSGRVTETIPAQNLKQRQADFLNRLCDADPQGRTIDRALLNEQNELSLILDRSVAMDKIPALMRTMLTQMAREFPGEDITVLACTPSHRGKSARRDSMRRRVT